VCRKPCKALNTKSTSCASCLAQGQLSLHRSPPIPPSVTPPPPPSGPVPPCQSMIHRPHGAADQRLGRGYGARGGGGGVTEEVNGGEGWLQVLGWGELWLEGGGDSMPSKQMRTQASAKGVGRGSNSLVFSDRSRFRTLTRPCAWKAGMQRCMLVVLCTAGGWDHAGAGSRVTARLTTCLLGAACISQAFSASCLGYSSHMHSGLLSVFLV
jgi:hypothetical protein